MSDQFLVRSSNDDSVFNLAVGEPVFLQEALHQSLTAIDPLPNLKYPRLGGEPNLLDELKLYHGGTTDHVVVTNGAKQALLAAFYAYRHLGMTNIRHPEPYWLSYPTLASLADMGFNSEDGDSTLLVSTSPNNPDGKESIGPCHIWDAAYAHDVYGWDGIQPPHGVAVYSAAKLLGASGLRVGWLKTSSAELARHAAHYVEITTSGVSTMSQQHIAGVLRDFRRHPDMKKLWYEKARRTLLKNFAVFDQFIGPHLAQPLRSGVGMFAFFKPENKDQFARALAQTQIKAVPGQAFGPSYEGWWRFNLGLRSETVEQALNILVSKL
jgi:aspartate/methionine/tyrosine aminotransferase